MHCHICNHTDVAMLDKPFEVYFCKHCSHEWSALPPERQETYSQEYFREIHKKWFEHPHLSLFNQINAFVNEVVHQRAGVISFLDVGCGQGDLLRFMRNAGSPALLSGIDLVLNTDTGIRYYQGDVVTFPFAKKFDVVSGLMVIEHIGDPHGFIQRITSLLNPRGIVIINTINASGLLYRLACVFRCIGFRGPFERLYDKHHLEHYGTRSLRALLESEGYCIRTQRVHNFPLQALDLPKGNTFLAFLYQCGVACAFFLTARWGGVHQTIVCEKK